MPSSSALPSDFSRSHALRAQIEASLASRITGALTPVPRTIREIASTGIAQIDDLLSGGLPVGAITEFVGPECSGRTSTALAFVAQRGSEGRVSAWVDVNDTLDPESAAANGVHLSQLLWVRCGEHNAAPGHPPQKTSAALLNSCNRESGTGQPKPSLEPKTVTRIQHGCAGQHPRGEIRGLDAAVEDLLCRQPQNNRAAPHTPGTSNRNLSAQQPLSPVMRSEQVSTDRQQRRSKYIVEHHESTCETFCPRCAEAAHKPRPEGFHSSHKILEPPAAAFNAQPRFKSAKEQRPWTRLDQALRATDLLLQAGGFSAIVLDLGSIGPEHASRIPLATWFRFRQVADHSRTSLIVLAQNSCAKSSAALLLRFEPMTALGSTVMEAAQFEAGNQRQRFVASSAAFPPPAFHAANARKQPQATWQSTAYSLACDQQYKQPRKLKGST